MHQVWLTKNCTCYFDTAKVNESLTANYIVYCIELENTWSVINFKNLDLYTSGFWNVSAHAVLLMAFSAALKKE